MSGSPPTFTTKDEVRNAVTNFGSWREIANKALPKNTNRKTRATTASAAIARAEARNQSTARLASPRVNDQAWFACGLAEQVGQPDGLAASPLLLQARTTLYRACMSARRHEDDGHTFAQSRCNGQGRLANPKTS